MKSERVRLSVDTDADTKNRLEDFGDGCLTDGIRSLAKLAEFVKLSTKRGSKLIVRDENGKETELLLL